MENTNDNGMAKKETFRKMINKEIEVKTAFKNILKNNNHYLLKKPVRTAEDFFEEMFGGC
jgi:hypothetical protein